MSRVISILSTVSLVAVLGCGVHPGDESVYTTDPSLTTTPAGEQLLVSLGDQEVASAMVGAASMIHLLRARSVDHTVAELRKSLAARGVDVSALKNIDEAILGKDLPSDLGKGSSGTTSDGFGTKTFALTKDYSKHFKCPVMANGKGANVTCDSLVAGVVKAVKQEIANNNKNVEQQVKKVFGDLSNEAQAFITAWAQAAKEHGSEVAAIYAEHELRAAAKCDRTADGMQISYILGVQQGHSIVLQMRAWAKKQVEACIVNIDEIVKQVRVTSMAKIEAYMKQNVVCEDADISQLNDVYKKAEVKRKEGIKVGIKQQVEVLRSELLSYSQKVPCGGSCWGDKTFLTRKPENECHLLGYSSLPGWWIKTDTYEVCCRQRRATKKVACVGKTKEGKRIWCKEDNSKDCLFCQTDPVPVGSPIAIDLDGDGLRTTERKVTFDLLADGTPQKVAWIGKGEALLVLDHDGDGRVNGGAELFGNATDCGGDKCYDGVVALKQWDASDRGGNADGMIDSRDGVYARLKLWVDKNSDGVSQACELSSLPARGVRAISLKAVYETERLGDSSITSRLSVLTDRGVRNAHDVWFAMELRPANLKALLPR